MYPLTSPQLPITWQPFVNYFRVSHKKFLTYMTEWFFSQSTFLSKKISVHLLCNTWNIFRPSGILMNFIVQCCLRYKNDYALLWNMSVTKFIYLCKLAIWLHTFMECKICSYFMYPVWLNSCHWQQTSHCIAAIKQSDVNWNAANKNI